VDERWAAGALEAGVNRLSVGVQSFDTVYLEAIGRCHLPGQAEKALKAAVSAGFGRVSSDLILGGPGSSVEIVLSGVERALELGVEHLSIYGYHLDPPATGFGLARYRPVDDDLWSDQYLAVCELLDNLGWRHYEISNWAGDDSALCEHNLFYWKRLPYLGLGPAAHSFGPGEVRTSNRPDLDGWLKAAMAGDFSSVREAEKLDRETVLFERVMLGLRLDDGVELDLLERIHGAVLPALLDKLIGSVYAYIQDNSLCLNDSGFLLYDTLAAELAQEAERTG
jgi:oxygen-independent coproporphyrinogen-3 oxidase